MSNTVQDRVTEFTNDPTGLYGIEPNRIEEFSAPLKDQCRSTFDNAVDNLNEEDNANGDEQSGNTFDDALVNIGEDSEEAENPPNGNTLADALDNLNAEECEEDEETAEIEEDDFEPVIADDPNDDGDDNNANLRNRLARLEAELQQKQAELKALAQKAKDAKANEDAAQRVWRAADGKQAGLSAKLSFLKDFKKDLVKEHKEISQEHAEKQKEWQEKIKHLKILQDAIDKLEKIAAGLYDESDALAERAENDAWNLAIQGASSLATAGLGKALDKVAGDYVDGVVKRQEALGNSLTGAQKEQLYAEARAKLGASVEEAGNEVIGEAAGAASVDGGTTLDSLSINVPGIGDVGVGDLGLDIVDGVINAGGALGNLLAALGVGDAATRAADQATELSKSYANLVGLIEKANVALLNDIAALVKKLQANEAKQKDIDKSISDTQKEFDKAIEDLNNKGNALIKAREKARQAQAEFDAKAPICQQKISTLQSQINNLRAQVAQNRVAGMAVSSHSTRLAYAAEKQNSPSERALNTHFFTAKNDGSNPLQERINRAFNLRTRDSGGVKGLTTWINGSFSGASGGDLATARSSSSFNISTGMQYQINERLAAGIAVRMADSDSQTAGTGTSIDSTLFGVALFSNITLPQDIRLQITGAYETANNDVASNGNTGSFTYDSLIFSASVSKAFRLQNGWTFTPNAKYATSHTDQDSYTDSAGTFNAGQEFDVSILSYGGTLAGPIYDRNISDTLYRLGVTRIGANIGLSGTTFLERADGTDSPSDTSNLQNESGGATLSGGLNFNFKNAASASLGGSITFADGEDPWSLNGSFSKPIDSDFTDAKLKPSSWSLNGSYTDLPDGRYSWSLGASVNLLLEAINESAPAGSTLAFGANVAQEGTLGANAKLQIPFR